MAQIVNTLVSNTFTTVSTCIDVLTTPRSMTSFNNNDVTNNSYDTLKRKQINFLMGTSCPQNITLHIHSNTFYNYIYTMNKKQNLIGG